MGKSQSEKALAFQALHRAPGVFIIPNPWDAGSAFLLQNLGFRALATTSAGLAFSLAKPDGANAVSRDETLANCRVIVEATELPVAADLENGFGNDPEECAETIRQAAAVGLVGGSIEDSTGRADNPIFALEHAAERVRAAAETAHGLAFPFTLTARAENYLHGRADLKDTIRRLQAFQEAGADCLFAPGLRTADDIRAVTSSVDRPVNVIMGLSGVVFSAEELGQMGVKRISAGSSLARAALGGFLRGAKELATHGTFNYAADAVPHGEINALFLAAR
jgi:2-methylisocitrate lyase-like PEP mutase family enzyme